MKKLALMAVAAILMLAFASAAMAQEKKKEWPKPGPNAKVLLENDKVRVQETQSKPGEKNPMVKRGDRVVYVLEGGPTKTYYADGKTEKGEQKKGTATYYPGGDTKSTENVGKTTTRRLIISLP